MEKKESLPEKGLDSHVQNVQPTLKSTQNINTKGNAFKSSSVKIPLSIEDLDESIKSEEEAQKKLDHISIQSAIPVNKAEFDKAFDDYIEKDEIKEKNLLYIILKGCIYEIIENRWIVSVVNEINKTKLLNHRDEIVNHLREQCNNPTLVMEIVVKEGEIKEEFKKINLSSEEKKQLMEEKNPYLKLLQQKFNTTLH